MIPRTNIPPDLLTLAALQAGVLSRQQVRGHQLSQTVIDRLLVDRWSRVVPGLYLTVPGAPSWMALAWGGVLLGGIDARLGPEASGHLHGLVPEAPKPVDVLVPAGRKVRVAGPWRFVREREGARCASTTGEPPQLKVAATLVDLCAARDASDVVGLLTTAVQRRLVKPAELVAELESRRAHPHRRLLTDLLSDVAEGAESALEVRWLRDVERAHGLPRGNRQRRVGLPHITDVLYGEFALIVELDGRDAHDGVGRFRDMNRDNAHALRDALTLRYGWFDVVDRPCSSAWQVAEVLVRRGWSGLPTRCASCAAVPDHELWSA